jgi:hypothetical protein
MLLALHMQTHACVAYQLNLNSEKGRTAEPKQPIRRVHKFSGHPHDAWLPFVFPSLVSPYVFAMLGRRGSNGGS